MREENENARERDDIVLGRNAVLELLKTDRQIECVYFSKNITGTALKIAGMAKDKGLVTKTADSRKLDAMCGNANHQGVLAVVSAAEYASLDDIFALAAERDEPVFLVIADEIEDPHNLGAIIRSAEAAGAHGLVIPKRRSAGLSYTVSKTSAGAAGHLPVVRVSNLVQTINELKKRGCWIYAADMGGINWCEADYCGPLALVVGSEGNGVGRLIKENCDFTVSLPMRGKISSLNASVAAGIILYEAARQRIGIKARNLQQGG